MRRGMLTYNGPRSAGALVFFLAIVGGVALPVVAVGVPKADKSPGEPQKIASVIFEAQQELREDRPEAALSLLNQTLSSDSTEAFWHTALLYWQGETFERLSRRSDAIRSYQAVVNHSPSKTFGVLAASRLAILLSEEEARRLTADSDPIEKLKDMRLKVMFLSRAAARGENEAVTELIRMAGESELGTTRKAAIRSLASIHNPEVDEFLVELIGREQDTAIMKAALYVVAARRSEASASVLKRIATSSDDESLRIGAIQALVNQRDPGISSFLKEVLRAETTPRVKIKAIQCLYGRGEIEASDLFEILDRKEDSAVRSKAAQALSLLDASRGLDARYLQKIQDIATRESDPGAWKYEIVAISKIGGRASLQALSEIAELTPKSEDRNHILKAMFATNSPDIIDAARDMLASAKLDDANLRTLAQGLGSVNSPEAFSLLDDIYRASDDPKLQKVIVQATLALALRLDKCQQGAELLLDFSSRSKDREVIRSVVVALMNLDCEEATVGARGLLERLGE